MYVPAGLMIYLCVGVGGRPQDWCFATLQALHLNPLASHDKQNMVWLSVSWQTAAYPSTHSFCVDAQAVAAESPHTDGERRFGFSVSQHATSPQQQDIEDTGVH